ncbi:hypothetical protein ASF99_02540 [Exiguobacterium sp. Leaf187]|uniref:Uncharacterized protein n=1 Tax=Exiguobacterium indicum TaxID=296995 RepID=A0A0V8GCE2_9BACL|nr:MULTISPECIES: hypothetical protein [Exiguobacterium]KQS18783.1 hypothetical protein ASF99_02540 [Exiguobacterium sp. Leaf187]KSU47857.1 hypothetical protein AS033_14440 [Exiguobacterium enclense]MCQ4090412.1 hypothetical protein [Exiguobacterium sp. LL15]NTY09410.1 hypothetical protein [Exiguobacterium sp. JMULE1]SDD29539.1 hypothetical protein SAMN05216342_2941 [Exiguobacterium enclense]
MSINEFFDWKINLEDELYAVIDEKARKMVVMGDFIELTAVLWLDQNDVLQLKPTWDCVISIDDATKQITIRSAESLNMKEEC